MNFIISNFCVSRSIPINWARNWSSGVNNSNELLCCAAYSRNFVISSWVGTIGNKISTWSGPNKDKSKRWTPDLMREINLNIILIYISIKLFYIISMIDLASRRLTIALKWLFGIGMYINISSFHIPIFCNRFVPSNVVLPAPPIIGIVLDEGCWCCPFALSFAITEFSSICSRCCNDFSVVDVLSPPKRSSRFEKSKTLMIKANLIHYSIY